MESYQTSKTFEFRVLPSEFNAVQDSCFSNVVVKKYKLMSNERRCFPHMMRPFGYGVYLKDVIEPQITFLIVNLVEPIDIVIHWTNYWILTNVNEQFWRVTSRYEIETLAKQADQVILAYLPQHIVTSTIYKSVPLVHRENG